MQNSNEQTSWRYQENKKILCVLGKRRYRFLIFFKVHIYWIIFRIVTLFRGQKSSYSTDCLEFKNQQKQEQKLTFQQMRLCLFSSSIVACRIIALIVDIFLKTFMKPVFRSTHLFKKLLLRFHDKHTQDLYFKKRLKILEN